MESGISGLTDGEEMRYVGTRTMIGQYATAGVVGSRDHWDGLLGDIDAELLALAVNGREVLANEVCGFVADIEKQAVCAKTLHLMIDGACHDIPGCQFGQWVETVHETAAIRQPKYSPFTAQCFGDQKGFGMGVEQTGGVELDELHVGHPAAGAPGHGDTVSGRDVRVAGVEVDLAGSAGCQNCRTGHEGLYLSAVAIENIGPTAAVVSRCRAASGDQIHHVVVFEQLDILPCENLALQGVLQFPPGGVGGVNNPSMGMSTLAG